MKSLLQLLKDHNQNKCVHPAVPIMFKFKIDFDLFARHTLTIKMFYDDTAKKRNKLPATDAVHLLNFEDQRRGWTGRIQLK